MPRSLAALATCLLGACEALCIGGNDLHLQQGMKSLRQAQPLEENATDPPEGKVLEPRRARAVPLGPLDVRTVDEVLPALERFTDLRAPSRSALRQWRHAQEHMFELTEPMRRWKSKLNLAQDPTQWARQSSGSLADEDFFMYFRNRFLKEPSFYMGWVYIPLPWHWLFEDIPRRRLSCGLAPIGMAAKMLQKLNRDFRYFTVMIKAHVLPRPAYKILTVPTLPVWDNVVVFESRGKENIVEGTVGLHPRVPVPLLYGRKAQLTPVENRSQDVFFAGACHLSSVRYQFGKDRVVGTEPLTTGRYNWNVFRCDEKVPKRDFRGFLQNSTWVVCPGGTMPATFMTYEAIQAGALPIIPFTDYANHGNFSSPAEGQEPFLWLPYQDIGVRWNEFAMLVPIQQLADMKGLVERMEPAELERRRGLLRKYRPLFTTEGLSAYILYVVSQARQQSTNWTEFYNLGRTVDFASHGMARVFGGAL
mmetsp:Transcript_70448/g.199794  ORF Transcript_70448/g.199794 Transcript_70448/m.199794 type:complete len:477 (-) Transcript_70448:131-1561(-)